MAKIMRRGSFDDEQSYHANIPKHVYDEAKKNQDELVDEDGLRVYSSLNHYIIVALVRLNRDHREKQ